MKKTLSSFLLFALVTLSMLSGGCWKSQEEAPKKEVIIRDGHKFSMSGIDTPKDFNAFLDSCSELERIQMLQALRQLPSFNSTEHIFNNFNTVIDGVMDGNISSLGEIYTNYNDVAPEDVLKAMRDGKIDRADISALAIRKALIWRSYNKVKYLFFDNYDEVDYHHDVLQWAAGQVGIPKKEREPLSTYQLEKEVSKKFFSYIWEDLTLEQREKAIHDLNMKQSWGFDVQNLKDLSDKVQLSKKLYDFMMEKDPRELLSLTKTAFLDYSFPEKDIVCTFIMTVSTIKSKQ